MPIYSGQKTFKALENIAAGDAVYILPSEIIDIVDGYASDAAVQAVWVDSDGANKMAGMSYQNVNYAQRQVLDVTSVAGNNNNDYVDKTITSKDLTGYTVNIVGSGSATSGDFEFLLSSGANAATSNVKQSLAFTAANIMQYQSFTVAGMTADNGSYTSSATTHIGIRCIDDTGSPYLKIARMWFTKTGTTYYGIKKTSIGLFSDTGSNTALAVGICPVAITSGNFGSCILFGSVVGGYSGLIPGYMYWLDNVNNVNTSAGALTPFINGHPAGGPASNPLYNHNFNYITAGVAISETELLLKAGYDYAD